MTSELAATRGTAAARTASRLGSLDLQLFALSFVALFLELTVIRWAPSVVRLLAYYANLMLISSFLGLGAGAMTSRTWRPMLVWLPVLLVADIAFLLLAQFVTLPGVPTEHRFYQESPQLVSYHVLIGIFLLNAAVFAPLGQRIGALFDALPPLRAYCWDLGGSLAGTLAFGVFSFEHFSPLGGFGLVAAVVLLLLPMRQWVAALPLLLLVLAAVAHANDPNAIWSPYYYITVREFGPGFDYVRDRSPTVREPPPNLRTMQDPPAYSWWLRRACWRCHLPLRQAG